MASEWKETTLGEIANIAMGQSPKGNSCNVEGQGVALLNGPTEFGSHHPVAAQFTIDPKRFAKKGDLLFCVRGSTTGRMNWADSEYAIGRGLAAFCHKEGDEYQSYLKGIVDFNLPKLLVSATGSTFPNVSKNQIHNLEIKLPPLKEQKAIAHILGSLDDKIELNRQMNLTLEAMAQALFKSWFVDFDPVIDNALQAGNDIPEALQARAAQRQALGADRVPLPENVQGLFPSEFVFSEELDKHVPLGWKVESLSSIANLNPESWTAKSMPSSVDYVDLANAKNGRINQTILYQSSEAPSRAKRILRTDDTIIGTVRPGNRSFAYIYKEGLTGSTGFAVMRPKEDFYRSFVYLNLTQDDVIDYFAHIADGGAYPAIKPDVVACLLAVIPSDRILKQFNTMVSSNLKKIGENQNDNETLTKLRDTLLPKLISGEVRVDDDMVKKILND